MRRVLTMVFLLLWVALVPVLSANFTVLSGTVVDTQGKPMPKLKLAFDYLQNYYYVFATDDQGKFSTRVPTSGTIELYVDGGKAFQVSDFEVVSPRTVTLPSPTEINIVVRPATKGRIVTPQGSPVAGVRVSFLRSRTDATQTTPAPFAGTWLQSTTNDLGEYPLPAYTSGDKLLMPMVIKTGAHLQSMGKFTVDGDHWAAGDTVMQLCNTTVSGKVVGADGAPVARALVFSPDCSPSTRVTTNDDGTFTLGNLPSGQVTLCAASQSDAVMTKVKTDDTAIALTLKPVTPTASADVKRAASLLASDKQRPAEQQLFYRDRTIWTQILVKSPLAMKDFLATAEITDDLKGAILISLARSNPARAATDILPKLPLITDVNVRSDTAIEVGLALAATNPSAAGQCYTIARSFTTQEGFTMKAQIPRCLALAKLAIASGNPNGSAILDKLRPLVIIPEATGALPVDQIGRFLALSMRCNPPELDNILSAYNNRSPVEQANIIAKAIEDSSILAPEDAKQLLMRYTGLNGGFDQLPKLITIIGKTDPMGAMEAAQSVPTNIPPYRQLACIAAVSCQPREQIVSLLHGLIDEANQVPGYDFDTMAEIAARIYAIDPADGGTQFQALLAKATSIRDNGFSNTLPVLAYFYGRLDPAEGRALLEEQYARGKEMLASDPDAIKLLANFPTYMSAIDVDRAIEMASELKAMAPGASSSNFGQNIMKFILATDEERLGLLHSY